MNYTENITFSTRLINAMVSYLEYLRKMVWPEKLAMFYPHAGNRGSIPWGYLTHHIQSFQEYQQVIGH